MINEIKKAFKGQDIRIVPDEYGSLGVRYYIYLNEYGFRYSLFKHLKPAPHQKKFLTDNFESNCPNELLNYIVEEEFNQGVGGVCVNENREVIMAKNSEGHIVCVTISDFKKGIYNLLGDSKELSWDELNIVGVWGDYH